MNLEKDNEFEKSDLFPLAFCTFFLSSGSLGKVHIGTGLQGQIQLLPCLRPKTWPVTPELFFRAKLIVALAN